MSEKQIDYKAVFGVDESVIKTIDQWQKDGSEIWIKRTSGEWQKVKVHSYDYSSVNVAWGQNRVTGRGGETKKIPFAELIRLQTEHGD